MINGTVYKTYITVFYSIINIKPILNFNNGTKIK